MWEFCILLFDLQIYTIQINTNNILSFLVFSTFTNNTYNLRIIQVTLQIVASLQIIFKIIYTHDMLTINFN